MNNELKGTICVLICVSLWALIPVVAKLGQSNLDNHQFLFWSSLVSFCVMAVLVLIKGTVWHLMRYSVGDWLRISCLGLLGTYVYYLFLYLGYDQAAGIEVLVTQYSWPIQIVLFSMIFLKERLTLKKSLSIILGLIGVMLVLTKGNLNQINISNPSVIALVGAGATCFALFSVFSKKVNKEPLGVIAVYFLVACVASFISMLCLSEFAFPSSDEIPAVLINGTLVNGISYVFWLTALKATEASYLAVYTFLTPVLSAIYLIVFFDEVFIAAYGFGLFLVLAGGIINSVSSRTNRSNL